MIIFSLYMFCVSQFNMFDYNINNNSITNLDLQKRQRNSINLSAQQSQIQSQKVQINHLGYVTNHTGFHEILMMVEFVMINFGIYAMYNGKAHAFITH